jgi:hypothetical protein
VVGRLGKGTISIRRDRIRGCFTTADLPVSQKVPFAQYITVPESLGPKTLDDNVVAVEPVNREHAAFGKKCGNLAWR